MKGMRKEGGGLSVRAGAMAVLLPAAFAMAAWGADTYPQPGSNDELLATTKIVPARDLNGGGDEDGRGDYPHIPKNGYLPDRLCGLDRHNMVRLALYVTLDRALEHDIEIPYDIRSQTPDRIAIDSGHQIKVVVPAGRTWAYSNPGCAKSLDPGRTFVVRGIPEYLSGAPGSMKAKVRVQPPGVAVKDGEGDILVYQFLLEFDDEGAPQYQNDESVRKGGSAFDGDLCVGYLGDEKFSGLEVKGYELTTNEEATLYMRVFSQLASILYCRPSGVDGTSLTAVKPDSSMSKSVVYTKTSNDSKENNRAMYGSETVDEPYLSRGDKSVFVALLGAKSSKLNRFYYLNDDLGLYRITSNPTIKMTESAGFWANCGGRDALVRKCITSSVHNDPATIRLSTSPRLAFEGRASCKLMAERGLEWHNVARAHRNPQGAVINLLGALPLNWKGVNFGKLLASVIPDGKSASMAVIACHMAYGVPSGTEEVLGPEFKRALIERETVKSSVSDNPFSVSAVASGSMFFGDKSVEAGHLMQSVGDENQPIVFSVKNTRIPLWINNSSQSSKGHMDDFAYGWLSWTKIDLKAMPDKETKHTEEVPYRIWELD